MPKVQLTITPFINLNPNDNQLRRIFEGFRSNILSKLSKYPNFKVFAESFDPYKDELYDGYIITGAFANSKGKINLLLSIYRDDTTKKTFQFKEREIYLYRLEKVIVESVLNSFTNTKKKSFGALPNQRLSQKAYENLLLAQYYSKKYTPKDNDIAISYYDKVLNEHPSHAIALSGVATVAFQQYRYGVRNNSVITNIRDWVQNSLDIEPDNVQAHTTKALVAMYVDKDFHSAGISFQNALQLKRDYVDVLKEYVWFLLSLYEDDSALKAINKALEYDPLSTELICTNADLVRYQEQYADALKLYKKAYDYDRSYSRAVEGITACYTYLDDSNNAKRYLEIYKQRRANQFFSYRLQCEMAQHFNDKSLWQKSLDNLLNFAKEHPEADLSSDLMSVYVRYKPDISMRYLTQAFHNGVGLASIIRYPVIKSLRKREDYKKLITKLNLDVSVAELSSSQATLLYIKSELNESFTIPRGFFVFAKAEGNYTNIHYIKDSKLVSKLLRLKLNALDKQLQDDTFIRIHNSYLVNMEQSEVILQGNAHSAVLQLGRYEISLPVSRAKYKLLKKIPIHTL